MSYIGFVMYFIKFYVKVNADSDLCRELHSVLRALGVFADNSETN